MTDAIMVPPDGGWRCARHLRFIGSRVRFRNQMRVIVIGGEPHCFECGRQVRWNWKHLTGGDRWMIQWHHVGTWSTYGGC